MEKLARLMSWGAHVIGRIGWRGWTALVLAILVIGALAVARLIATPSSNDGANSPADSSPEASPTLPYDGDAAAHPGDVAPSNAPAPQAAIDVAVNFVTEWASHPADESAEQWWSRVSPYADTQLADELKLTDPTRVPATKLTGNAKTTSNSSTRADISIPTDAGNVKLVCTRIGEVWLVSDIDLEAEG